MRYTALLRLSPAPSAWAGLPRRRARRVLRSAVRQAAFAVAPPELARVAGRRTGRKGLAPEGLDDPGAGDGAGRSVVIVGFSLGDTAALSGVPVPA